MINDMFNYFPINMNEMMGELYPDPRPANAEANMDDIDDAADDNDDAAAEDDDAADGNAQNEDDSDGDSVWSGEVWIDFCYSISFSL